MKLPEDLERREILLEPAEDIVGCKAIDGPGLLAQVITSKYCNHLPLYRQQQRFKREGLHIPYSMLNDWITGNCRLLASLYNALRKTVLQSDYLNVDETPIKVLDSGKKGATKRGYYWVYHAGTNKNILFDYQPGRGREGPTHLLQEFKGYLQVDGYGVYDAFSNKPGVTLLHCMSHARRTFYDALSNNPARAGYALKQFALLYAIERMLTGITEKSYRESICLLPCPLGSLIIYTIDWQVTYRQ